MLFHLYKSTCGGCICLGVIVKDTKGNVEKQVGEKSGTKSTPFSVQRVIKTSERRKEF